MPGVTGLDVLRITKAEGLRTRIILLTGSSEEGIEAEALSAGAWGMMRKHAAANELEDCLRQVAEGEQWFATALPAVERETGRGREAQGLDNLTSRELEIARFVAAGLSNKQIARMANITEGTVKIHLHNAYHRLGAANRTALAMLVSDAGS
jgi:DNA-binding NarL/FixJ family response regulator